MAELEFSYDIAGHDDIEINLSSGFTLSENTIMRLYTTNSGPLTFGYDIAGHQTEKAFIQSEYSLTTKHRRSIVERVNLTSQYQLSGKRKWHIRHLASINSSATLSLIHYLNIGYQDDVYFGNIQLANARYDAIDKLDFPFREKVLYGGYRSILSKKVMGYSGRFVCETNDWNDIQRLIDNIGVPRTLRIYGKPYRNVYIKPPLEIKTVKPKVNRWVYWVEFMQDSAIVEISE